MEKQLFPENSDYIWKKFLNMFVNYTLIMINLEKEWDTAVFK